MCTPSKKCMRPGPITSNGYLNFLREFRKKRGCGLSAVDTVRCGAKEWNKLSCSQKARYRRMGNCAKKKKRKSCGRKRRPKKRSCRPKKRKRSCRPKKRKRSCRPKKKRSCRPKKKRSCRPKRRKRRCGGKKRKRCFKPGPVTNNGYLNFLRWFRRTHCGLSPVETIRKGARKWCSLPQEKKDRFNRMACKVSTSKRRKKTPLCRCARKR